MAVGAKRNVKELTITVGGNTLSVIETPLIPDMFVEEEEASDFGSVWKKWLATIRDTDLMTFKVRDNGETWGTAITKAMIGCTNTWTLAVTFSDRSCANEDTLIRSVSFSGYLQRVGSDTVTVGASRVAALNLTLRIDPDSIT